MTPVPPSCFDCEHKQHAFVDKKGIIHGGIVCALDDSPKRKLFSGPPPDWCPLRAVVEVAR